MVRFFLNTFTPNAICTLVTLVCMQYILRPFKAFAYFAFHEKAIKSFDGVPVPVLSMALIHQQKKVAESYFTILHTWSLCMGIFDRPSLDPRIYIWGKLFAYLASSIGSTTCNTLKQVEQNATNNLAPFFKSAFKALSDGMLRFAHCVAP